MKFRQPKIVDLCEKIVERMTPTGTQKVQTHYVHLMFGPDLLLVRVSESTAAWIQGKEPK